MKKIIFYLCISGIIAAVVIYMYSLNGKDKKPVDNSTSSNENVINSVIPDNPASNGNEGEDRSCHDYFVKKMNEMNFNPELIEKIFDCNEMVFTSWYEYNPKQ